MASASAQSTIERKADLISDIGKLRAQVEDGLAMGDSMFGQFAHVDVTNEVNRRLSDLKKKKRGLEQQLREKEAIIQRSNRDFSDVKDSLPETQERKRVQFVEDYTMMFLLLSYVFMILSFIIFYVTLSEQKMKAFFYSLGISMVFTFFGSFLIYLIA
jgi:hypothetical protein